MKINRLIVGIMALSIAMSASACQMNVNNNESSVQIESTETVEESGVITEVSTVNDTYRAKCSIIERHVELNGNKGVAYLKIKNTGKTPICIFDTVFSVNCTDSGDYTFNCEAAVTEPVLNEDESVYVYAEFEAENDFVEHFNSEDYDLDIIGLSGDHIAISGKVYNKFEIKNNRIMKKMDYDDLVFEIDDSQFSSEIKDFESPITIRELQDYDNDKASGIYSIKACLYNADGELIGIRECEDDDELTHKSGVNTITFRDINGAKFEACKNEEIDHIEVVGGECKDYTEITDLA